MALSQDGLVPRAQASATPPPREICLYPYLLPRSPAEGTLLSGWVNTHQALFISTGCAAQCVTQLLELLAKPAVDLDRVAELSGRAVDCRRASAAYTSLPFLNREGYEAYIRESMKCVHPGFSGVSNREAMALEKSLGRLKRAQQRLPRATALAVRPLLAGIYEADREWWRHHGRAMARYVTNPVSLARMDFKHQARPESFDLYRQRVLRNSRAMADYDRYFAVTRSSDLSPGHYRAVLTECLQRSDPYVDEQGPLAEYRARGAAALFETIDSLSSKGHGNG